jgi:YebC/PmpR family DNA-binding regulatory protein
MAGHSKWAQIKRKKADVDQKRGALFGKLVREIAAAAHANPDPETNLQLRSAIEKAKAANMPNENIERALNQSAGKNKLERVLVEIVGPGGIAILVIVATDNRNRTIHEVRTVVKQHGARVTQPGSLLWMFSQDLVPTTTISVASDFKEPLRKLKKELLGHPDVRSVASNEQDPL